MMFNRLNEFDTYECCSGNLAKPPSTASTKERVFDIPTDKPVIASPLSKIHWESGSDRIEEGPVNSKPGIKTALVIKVIFLLFIVEGKIKHIDAPMKLVTRRRENISLICMGE